MFRWLKDYLRLGIFAMGLLIGVQVPAFIQQYDDRVNAHLLEAKQSLAGFQFTADRYFQGSIEKLIEHYRNSDDQVFNQDAHSIQAIYDRVMFLQNEARQMQQSSAYRALHVFSKPSTELFDETVQRYNYTVPLSPLALIWGLICALLLAMVIDGALGGCAYCARRLTRRGGHAH